MTSKSALIDLLVAQLLEGKSIYFPYDEIDPTYFDYYHHYTFQYEKDKEQISIEDFYWTNDAATPAQNTFNTVSISHFKMWVNNSFGKEDLQKLVVTPK